MAKATVLTIGFTKTTAEGFFERLLNAGVKKVVDVRLHNTSQLAGFAKVEDQPISLKRSEAFTICTSLCWHRLIRC